MKTLLSILLAAVGLASANSGDTTRLDTLAYGRDTCGGAKTCRYVQVKIHPGTGFYIDSSRVARLADSLRPNAATGYTRASGPVVPGAYVEGLPNGAMAVGSDGDLITIQAGQPMFRGSTIYRWSSTDTTTSHVAPTYDYQTKTISASVTTETDQIATTTAGRNGLVPKVRANFLRSTGSGIIGRIRFGCNMGTVAASGTMTFRVYLQNVLVARVALDFSKMTSIPLNSNLSAVAEFWLEPIAYVNPGTSLRLRSHGRQITALQPNITPANSLSAWIHMAELYSNIDATVDSPMKVTAQWGNPGTGATVYLDGVDFLAL